MFHLSGYQCGRNELRELFTKLWFVIVCTRGKLRKLAFLCSYKALLLPGHAHTYMGITVQFAVLNLWMHMFSLFKHTGLRINQQYIVSGHT